MPRVLIAQSDDWIGPARLPAMLSRAGVSCDLIDAGNTDASASSHLRGRTAIAGGIEAIAHEVLRVADNYDRVIVCQERLILEIMRVGGEDAIRVLPGSRQGLQDMCDKVRFSPAARAGGLRVADAEVADSAHEAEQAAIRLGGRVVVKGRWGAGGAVVRVAESPEAAGIAAEQLGSPVLVETFIEGDLLIVSCLYEAGKLVAALTARKLDPMRPNGPSSVNEFLPVDERIRTACERLGEVFGVTGFASVDVFIVDDGDPVVIEINPRPGPQPHLGKSVGVDMARAYSDVLSGRWDGTPRLADRSRTVRLFPQSLVRYRELEGRGPGTRSWLASRGALSDLSWDDLGLLAHHVRRYFLVKR